ncbi:MAG: hypothetical protein P8X74_15525 [Reinekea sp.]
MRLLRNKYFITGAILGGGNGLRTAPLWNYGGITDSGFRKPHHFLRVYVGVVMFS